MARRLAQQETQAAEERRRAETARWREESLARMGEMAAVVAHEVRNPLAGIKGVLQAGGRRLPAESGERRALREATLRLDSLQALTEDPPLSPRRAAGGDAGRSLALAGETAGLLRADRGLAGLTVETGGEPRGASRGSPAAAHDGPESPPQRGRGHGGKGRVVVDVHGRGDEVELRVEDDGPGVPEEERERILELFFTTRARGTGLGPAIVRRVAEAHGGEVTVETAAGGGASFRVRLPRAASSSGRRPPPAERMS